MSATSRPLARRGQAHRSACLLSHAVHLRPRIRELRRALPPGIVHRPSNRTAVRPTQLLHRGAAPRRREQARPCGTREARRSTTRRNSWDTVMETILTFRDYQKQAILTNRVQGDDLPSLIVPLLGLAGEAGSLLAEYKKWMREGDRYRPFTDQVAEEIGDILWYLANIAEKAGLDLQEIAEENLAKTADRFNPKNTNSMPLFGGDRYDATYPESEQLPLSLTVEFREIEVDGKRKLE